ncbi:hypothetical protein [Roseinatronobacter alkalisoli]|uniref:Uncharacterized protein n=1 Tax=Roseinatronobacter alkalisoli TaxID=3028235 RepID=A0ABT5TA67_9RHOB|nr:hypothetical protein [Roseinatronobacter sp. HJB301]MDD7971087.1 hypothetical protein [Roseinatronobacter sp. HJB301]
MTEQSPQQLEGRLNAQREVLAALLAWAMRQPGSDFPDALDAEQGVQDHQEDPGVLADSAFAIEGAAAREMQILLERAKAIRDTA